MSDGSPFAAHKSVPFAVGSLTGLRSFRVTSDGRLTAINFPYVYHGGENHARCEMGIPDSVSVRFGEYHHVAVQWCTCGFYAYYNGKDSYSSVNTVTGIVQGYGKCTYGAEGFRAQKVRILAIINPHLTDKQVREQEKKDKMMVENNTIKPLPWRGRFMMSRWCDTLIVSLILLYGLVIFGFNTLSPPPWTIIPCALFWITDVFAVTTLIHKRRKWRGSKSWMQKKTDLDIGIVPPKKESFAKISAQYPHVPQYRSNSEALKIFPLTDYYKETPGGRARRKDRGFRL